MKLESVPHFRNISDAWNSSHRVLSEHISQTAHSNGTLNPAAWKMQITAQFLIFSKSYIRGFLS